MSPKPLHIALSTVGSTGDTQPFIALGKALREAGHEVLAFSHPFHQERFEAHGVPFHPCGPEVELDELNDLLSKMLEHVNPLTQLRILMEEAFFADYRKYFEDARMGMEKVDLVLGHMVDFVGMEAATQLNKPRIGALLAPTGIPTKHSAPFFLRDLGAGVNQLAWKILVSLLYRMDHDVMARLRELGGTQQKIQHYHTLSPDLNLVAASPILSPTFPDLPAHFTVTGPWILPEPEFVVPPDLEAFVEQHPRPVVISFGSMGGNLGPQLTATVVEALTELGVAGVVQSGYAGLFREDAPSHIHFAEYVPHGWLFPRASCVVHHGGAGTTMAACRAGVPSVVVTFIADQPYHAYHLKRLGIAPKMIWYRHLTTAKLVDRISEVLGSPTMKARARELRPQFLAEKGTERAIQAIENFAQSRNLF